MKSKYNNPYKEVETHREIKIDNSKPVKDIFNDLLKRGINEKVRYEPPDDEEEEEEENE